MPVIFASSKNTMDEALENPSLYYYKGEWYECSCDNNLYGIGRSGLIYYEKTLEDDDPVDVTLQINND